MLSHQQARNEIAGKKAIILNPTIEQKNGTEVVTFEEGVPSQTIPQLIPRKSIHWTFLYRLVLVMHVERHHGLQFFPRRILHIFSN